MDAFVSRKRRKLEDTTSLWRADSRNSPTDDEDSTEVKLAILSSLHPHRQQDELLEMLLSCEGSVEAATNALAFKDDSPRKKGLVTVGMQSSLAFGQPRDAATVRRLTKKGKTLHLFSPEDIANQTPCSIVHNFLPSDLAGDLLRELLPEATSFSSATFKLFDNVVQSPHTACFYVDSIAERQRQTSTYLYNGATLTDVREILPVMRNVKSLVKDAVNNEVRGRIRNFYPESKKLQYQDPHDWEPNAAFVNCYDGGAQSVGYHSDQLTYLGPRAVIGSLSLGVAREFRVRKIVPKESDSADTAGDDSGQIAIHLPHNSLLVMHAEMQEEWKHSVHPAANITPHPIAGNKRINITYRYYRPEYAPIFTPRCRCGVPTQLKTVQRQKANRGRYMWMCQAGNTPGEQGCGFFEWAEFTDDGIPIWKSRPTTQLTRDGRVSDSSEGSRGKGRDGLRCGAAQEGHFERLEEVKDDIESPTGGRDSLEEARPREGDL